MSVDTPTAPAPAAAPARPARRLPWVVAARLARRDVRRSPGRTALVAALLALPVAVVTLLLVTYATQGQPPSPADVLEPGVEADLWVSPTPLLQSGPDHADRVKVDGDVDRSSWEAVEASLRATLPGASGWATADCRRGLVPGRGTWTNLCTYLPVGAPAGVVTGRAPEGPSEALVPEGSAVKVGDTVDVVVGESEERLVVVGTYPEPRYATDLMRVGADPEVPVDLETVEVRLVAPTVTWSDVVRLNAAGFSGVARAALTEDPPAEAVPYLVAGHAPTDQGRELDDATAATLALGAVALVLVLVLVVTPAQVVGVRRSTRTYALLAATGADARTLRWVVLVGAALQGLVAALVGVGLGLAAVLVIDLAAPKALTGTDAVVTVPWGQVGAIVAGTTLLVLVSALVPARTAARLDVVRVLAGRRGEAAPSRRTPVVGTGLVVLGAALGTWAVLGTSPALVAVALVTVVAGLLLCAGTLVDLAARALAHRVPLPARLALRDAVRHRSRSVAAVTAVTAAAATLVGASLVMTSDAAHTSRVITFGAGDGAVVGYVGHEVLDGSAQLAAAVEAARAVDPAGSAVTVASLGTTRPGIAGTVPLTWDDGTLDVAPNVARLCPAHVEDGLAPEERERIAGEDPRCAPVPSTSYGFSWFATAFVDDGTWTAGTGLPGADVAAEALAAGKVVVNDAQLLQDDGTVRLRYLTAEDGAAGGEAPEVAYVTYPAVLVAGFDRTAFSPVLPPEVAARLGLGSAPLGVVALPSDDALRDDVAAAVRGALGSAGWVVVEDHDAPANPLLSAILMGTALVLGIGTAGLVLLLVAGEARADLAVLSAVGAAPRTRRRLAAAQAAVLVAVGTVLGTVVGFAVGAAFVALSARRDGFVDPTWTLAVPWGQVAAIVLLLPVGAWLTGWATTRSRMPLPSEVR